MFKPSQKLVKEIIENYNRETKTNHDASVTVMNCGGFKASLMRAARLVGNGVHGLPPGTPVEVFPIASLPGCPDEWVKAAGTYVCPVSPSWGLWFDWTMNDKYNTAIVASVKGMNPITGQKIEHLGMEQYKNQCPIHDIDFSHDRYCSKCDYKWPAQNYVTYPNTLWWDGFRSPDGNVRQFFFTEDEKRDIASLVIGKENVVPAFGFIFYQPKNPRVVAQNEWTRGLSAIGSNIKYGAGGSAVKGLVSTQEVSHFYDSSQYKTVCSSDMMDACNDEDEIKEVKTSFNNILRSKDVSVGGGAKIVQNLTEDSLALDAWNEKESALIRLYFVFEEQFAQIVEKGGIKDISGTEDGYLSGLPLG